jgi:SNF2 family DNA or RNA helicase
MEQTDFQTYLENAGLDKKQHQLDGVDWMLNREKNIWEGVRGGIIADEMGLGKTIMTIGTVLSNFTEHTLIVLPLALLQQWREEIQRTTGFEPLVYHGTMKRKTPLSVLKTAQIVLTTYGEIQISRDEFSTKPPSPLHLIEWDRVVFDEAHHLRNMNTAKFNGGSLLKSTIRWMITGTPIQNRTTDLYALCHVLGFDKKFYSSKTDDIIEQCMMRRTKESVGINISKLTENTIPVPWNSRSERVLAEDIHGPATNSIVTDCVGFADGVISDVGDSRGARMLLMLRARQMCILPEMLKKKYDEYLDEGFISEEEFDDSDFLLNKTSKMDIVTRTLIERKGNNNRKIVFCHFHMEIDEIKKRCLEAGMSVRTMDGRLKAKEKKIAMKAPWPEVMILQINTCCEGLNLQEFNEIYFVSPHWNPAVEDQAVARCHRIGQKKEVHVFRFNMEGMDEEGFISSQDSYCNKVQGNKRKLYVY